jgi:hypothetical protein
MKRFQIRLDRYARSRNNPAPEAIHEMRPPIHRKHEEDKDDFPPIPLFDSAAPQPAAAAPPPVPALLPTFARARRTSRPARSPSSARGRRAAPPMQSMRAICQVASRVLKQPIASKTAPARPA